MGRHEIASFKIAGISRMIDINRCLYWFASVNYRQLFSVFFCSVFIFVSDLMLKI